MEADERHHNPMGTLHGGIYCDLADAAMGYAYAATLGEGETFTTVELKINFLRPVRKGRLTAEAKVIKAGSALGYVECDVTDQAGKLVARAASTCMKLRESRPAATSCRPVSSIDALEATMAIQGRWKLLVCTIMLAGVVLAGVLVYGRFGVQRPGGNPMNDSRFTVNHVRRTTDKPFDEVTRAFEAQLGKFDGDVRRAATASDDSEEAKAKIAAMAGPSGFMLFGTSDHGALLRLAGQNRKAIQYVVGNPVFALQMTQHDIRASLYAPLRVLIYEDDEGKTCVEYDKPSSLFGQFGNAGIAPVASMLDRKLEDLVTIAIR